MSERLEVERAIRQYFEGINTRDASMIPLADEVEMSGPMMPQPISGVADVRQYIDETAPFMARMECKTTIIEGENAAVTLEFEGLNGVVIEGAEFYRVRNGLIRHLQVFFDTRLLFKGAN